MLTALTWCHHSPLGNVSCITTVITGVFTKNKPSPGLFRNTIGNDCTQFCQQPSTAQSSRPISLVTMESGERICVECSALNKCHPSHITYDHDMQNIIIILRKKLFNIQKVHINKTLQIYMKKLTPVLSTWKLKQNAYHKITKIK